MHYYAVVAVPQLWLSCALYYNIPVPAPTWMQRFHSQFLSETFPQAAKSIGDTHSYNFDNDLFQT